MSSAGKHSSWSPSFFRMDTVLAPPAQVLASLSGNLWHNYVHMAISIRMQPANAYECPLINNIMCWSTPGHANKLCLNNSY